MDLGACCLVFFENNWHNQLEFYFVQIEKMVPILISFGIGKMVIKLVTSLLGSIVLQCEMEGSLSQLTNSGLRKAVIYWDNLILQSKHPVIFLCCLWCITFCIVPVLWYFAIILETIGEMIVKDSCPVPAILIISLFVVVYRFFLFSKTQKSYSIVKPSKELCNWKSFCAFCMAFYLKMISTTPQSNSILCYMSISFIESEYVIFQHYQK